jgi:hypothetical protein
VNACLANLEKHASLHDLCITHISEYNSCLNSLGNFCLVLFKFVYK